MSIFKIEYCENVDELFPEGNQAGSFGVWVDFIDVETMPENLDEIEKLVKSNFGKGKPKIDTKNVKYVIFSGGKIIHNGYISNPAREV